MSTHYITKLEILVIKLMSNINAEFQRGGEMYHYPHFK